MWLSPCCDCLVRLKETDVWGQSEVLRILQRYRPQTEDELFDVLSLLDASLVSPHPVVMAATLSLFLSLCSGLPAVCVAALERVCGPLLAACGSVSGEMRFTALCHIQVCGIFNVWSEKVSTCLTRKVMTVVSASERFESILPFISKCLHFDAMLMQC